MAGVVCLQGGREFTAACRDMDAAVLSLAPTGAVAVLAGAARPGSDYDGASDRARRHYAALGADVVIVPDPRASVDEALSAMTDAIGLVVLPGGSPQSLRQVLSGAIEARLIDMHENGVALSGASAGAMVLCSQMVRPGSAADVVDGLGVIGGLALPHWTPGSDRGWPIPEGLDLWGLPECGGVVIIDHDVHAVGQGTPSRRLGDVWRPVASLEGRPR